MHRRIEAAHICRTVLLIALVGLLGGCGGSDDGRITVLAAASLSDVLPAVDSEPRYGFAGSDLLAAQIREGAPADVYVAADERLPIALFGAGLVERPRTFATNRLVLLVPADNPRGVARVADLRTPGVRIVMADAGVPVGDYTRAVLANLGAADLVAAAVSQEDDVRAVTQKVALGEADAGFAYATDAIAVGDDVVAVALPAAAQPPIRYGIAVLSGTRRRAQARAFVARVLGPAGQAALRAAGFGPP